MKLEKGLEGGLKKGNFSRRVKGGLRRGLKGLEKGLQGGLEKGDLESCKQKKGEDATFPFKRFFGWL